VSSLFHARWCQPSFKRGTAIRPGAMRDSF
jgi:hypothetical protein